MPISEGLMLRVGFASIELHEQRLRPRAALGMVRGLIVDIPIADLTSSGDVAVVVAALRQAVPLLDPTAITTLQG